MRIILIFMRETVGILLIVRIWYVVSTVKSHNYES